MTGDTELARLQPTIQLLRTACADDDNVLAAWLEGSIAKGAADEWSDVDIHLLINDRESFDIMGWIENATPHVLIDAIPGLADTYICITPEWVHIDVVVHTVGDTLAADTARRILLDPKGLVSDTRSDTREAGDPGFPYQQIRDYLYWMGAAVTAFRRGDLVNLAQTTSMMRDRLLPRLMLAENGVPVEASSKRMTQNLTAEQLDTLRGIPAVSIDETALLRAQEAIAREYLDRAHRLARMRGADDWPSEFEQATKDLWVRELQIAL